MPFPSLGVVDPVQVRGWGGTFWLLEGELPGSSRGEYRAEFADVCGDDKPGSSGCAGLGAGDVPAGAAWIALHAEEVVRALASEGG